MAASDAEKKVSRPGRIRSGWMLAKLSWRVLMLDKELVVFPLLSGLSCVLVLAGFAGGAWSLGLVQVEGQAEVQEAPDQLAFAAFFAWYFVNYFVILFFNSALIACAIIRFQGGDPTVRDGLRAAGERIAQIAAWALVASTVGVLLRVLEDRVGFAARIVVAVLGAAWTIAAYFVVPVLVVEKLGPIEAFRRSTSIIRETWGESLASNIGIGAIAMFIALLVMIAGGVATGMLYAQTQNGAVALAAIGVTLLLLILITLASSALSAIVVSALYLYAAEKKLPDAFQGAGAEGAFVKR
jgi:hypothetical protein